MADALFIFIVIGFFALMVLLVKACDHIIGPDDLPLDPTEIAPTDVDELEEVGTR